MKKTDYSTEENRISYWEKWSKEEGLNKVDSTPNNEKETHNIAKFIINNFDFSDETVLDAGCGIGRFFPTLFYAGARKIIGVDFSKGMIEEAKTVRLPIPVEFYQTPLEKLDLPDNSVDTVFSFLVLQHITNKQLFEKTVGNLKRIAKKRVVIFNNGMDKEYRKEWENKWIDFACWFPEDYSKIMGDDWEMKKIKYTYLQETIVRNKIFQKLDGMLFERKNNVNQS